MTALGKHLLQFLCLIYRPWESIEDHTLVLFAKGIIDTCEDVNNQGVGNKHTVVDILLGYLAKFCTVLDFVAKHITCRDVVQTILFDEQVALGAFS